jgi:hypothetical protein
MVMMVAVMAITWALLRQPGERPRDEHDPEMDRSCQNVVFGRTRPQTLTQTLIVWCPWMC